MLNFQIRVNFVDFVLYLPLIYSDTPAFLPSLVGKVNKPVERFLRPHVQPCNAC
jgi:hypothetical protein